MTEPENANAVSLSDRIDPDGVAREQMRLGAAATSPLGTFLLRALGVSHEDIEALRDALRAASTITALGETALTLGQHGWVHFELAPGEAGHRAATMFREGRVSEADDLLVEAWNESDQALFRMARHRIHAMYWSGAEDDEPSPIGEKRGALIDDAIEFHRMGKFSGSIPIVVAQADGIVADWSEDGKGLFRRNWDGSPGAKVVDMTTMAGHPTVLLAFSHLLTERVDETSTSGVLARHGILHGRELGYDTIVNSTKAFAGLLAVVVWAQGRAQARLKAEAEEREARFAGSKERDANGRRLDRRGFSPAKASLMEIALLQDQHWEVHRGYSSDLSALDPAGLFFKGPEPKVRTSTEGLAYWSWLRSEAGYILGVGRCPGEGELWYFGADDPPLNGPPSAGWQHGAHADW